MIFGIMIISGIFTVIGMILSGRLKSKFAHYSQVPLDSGMNGAQVAQAMLEENGLHDVRITQVDGQLTDHYNPQDRTVNLSYDVYHGRSVAAAAVAAHECGHAVQHATGYSMLQMRSALVPVVNIAATMQQYVFMFGLGGMYLTNNPTIMVIVLGIFAVTTLFSLVTLPVEFDASNRALAWLDRSGVAARGAGHEGAKDALWWAAMTYVAAAMAALVQFLYLLMMFMGRRE
ncbi:MAG: zinc metallopeptidase [Saprospiraceae bacterium]|nr:zinc metallopeptidase [Saprospiraceae bacterium]